MHQVSITNSKMTMMQQSSKLGANIFCKTTKDRLMTFPFINYNPSEKLWWDLKLCEHISGKNQAVMIHYGKMD